MIDVIKQQFKGGMSLNEKLNLTREFLQLLTLKILDDKDFFDRLAFVGGTSLRILYDLKRFSEDLDFSLTRPAGYSFERLHDQLLNAFQLYNLPFETRPRTVGHVHSMMMRFAGLPKELGFSELPGQKLSIKLEIDINPPEGWQVNRTIVNKIYMFHVAHYDLPSLYAGKLHACFYRKFTKGRDFYDFVWYLSKKVRPNLVLLNNAIRQTHPKDAQITEENFKDFLLRNVGRIDFEHVKKDVERFLEDKKELRLLDPELIQETIRAVY